MAPVPGFECYGQDSSSSWEVKPKDDHDSQGACVSFQERVTDGGICIPSLDSAARQPQDIVGSLQLGE